MMRLYLEHLLSILFVTAFMGGLAMVSLFRQEALRSRQTEQLGPYLEIKGVDLGDPLHAALLKETLNRFFPDSPERNDSLMEAIQSFRLEQFSEVEFKTIDGKKGLTIANMGRLAPMYAEFILIYLIVMALTYHATQTLAIIRFVRRKQRKKSFFLELFDVLFGGRRTRRVATLLKQLFVVVAGGLARGLAYCILFSPAYVVAYSIRSGIQTDSIVFLVILGAATNGLLINYANKFYTFLVTESRKGYVQTAVVKNLDDSYVWGAPDGIPYRALFRPKRLFPSHVFRHIYLNARFQYLTSIKEHATFLITGLIIMEMALNIQGHIGYALMQNILYKQYDVVFLIILAIFLVVKATEIVIDTWIRRESMKYENRD